MNVAIALEQREDANQRSMVQRGQQFLFQHIRERCFPTSENEMKIKRLCNLQYAVQVLFLKPG